MPDGRIQRIDDEGGVAYLVRRGRTYSAPLDEVETRARKPSARVRFDLVRHNGSESAANVRLRTGTRTNRRQRRFGDLSGAKQPGAKVATIASRAYGVNVTTQPFRVAKAWLEAMGDQNFDAATSLYLSGARLIAPDVSVAGRRAIRVELERSPLVGVDVDRCEVHGFDRYVRITCGTGTSAHVSYLEVARGAIVEQWIDVEPDVTPAPEDTTAIDLVHHGKVAESDLSYAEDKLTAVIDAAGRPVGFARLKLTRAENPAIERPAMVEAAIEFDRTMIRAHSAARTFTEAADLVADRLRAGIEHNRDRRAKTVPPGVWRHGDPGRQETPYFDRPDDEREIVRHKSFAADELTIDEAAWDMAMLDYDFFLFVELETGADTLLARAADGALQASQVQQSDEPPAASTEEIEWSTTTAPLLEVSEAVDLLNESGDRRLFFRNASSGRANVLYRRYDGHYGLITPPSRQPSD